MLLHEAVAMFGARKEAGMRTKKRLTRIAPLQAGIFLAIFYGLISLVVVPFVLLGPHSSGGRGPIVPFLLLFLPVLYAAGGFVGGIIVAAIYNLTASWTGGLEFEVEEVPPVS